MWEELIRVSIPQLQATLLYQAVKGIASEEEGGLDSERRRKSGKDIPFLSGTVTKLDIQYMGSLLLRYLCCM